MMIPSAPSLLCSQIKVTDVLKCGSGIPGMAIAAAIGAINVAKIASQPAGFAEGTPGLDFQNFGNSRVKHALLALFPPT